MASLRRRGVGGVEGSRMKSHLPRANRPLDLLVFLFFFGPFSVIKANCFSFFFVWVFWAEKQLVHSLFLFGEECCLNSRPGLCLTQWFEGHGAKLWAGKGQLVWWRLGEGRVLLREGGGLVVFGNSFFLRFLPAANAFACKSSPDLHLMR